jgi:hypothetical protein
MKLRTGYPSRIIEGYAFLLQQRLDLLSFKQPLIAVATLSISAQENACEFG